MNARRVHAIFERLRARNPHPKTELEYASPFELLVAVILSAQATDKSVNVATRRLFADANTPQAILALGVDGLATYVKSIGLYQGKAKNIIATCRLLIDEHGGRVPRRPGRARIPAGRRTQDGERDPEHRIRAADARRRHACVPGGQSYRACAVRRTCAGWRTDC